MKKRFLVMNGQRIVQIDQGGVWANEKVEKAGTLKPGIYNLYRAKEADKSKRHDGVIVHTDKNSVYQKVGSNFVMHPKSCFDIVPDVESATSISYNDEGRAVVAKAAKLSRGRSR